MLLFTLFNKLMLQKYKSTFTLDRDIKLLPVEMFRYFRINYIVS